MTAQSTNLDAATARAIAVKASCDPRTVRRFWLGEAIRPMVAERIRAALGEVGLSPALPAAVSVVPAPLATVAPVVDVPTPAAAPPAPSLLGLLGGRR